MQIKNLIAFFALSAAVLVGWVYFQNWMWPPKQRPAKFSQEPAVEWPWKDLRSQDQATILTRLLGASTPGWSGLDTGTRLVAEIKRDDPALKMWLAQEREKARPKPVVAKSETVNLGDDSFNLQVKLTSKGAGVQQVVLTKFQEANDLGLPVKDGNAPVPLHLVPKESNTRFPSNLLYHYATPAEKHPEHPEAALGEIEWVLKSKKIGANDDPHEVVFTCDVPGQFVRLTKTYTLAKGDYHVGLAITMEHIGSGSEAVPFRYQIMGAHGLPIEGKWYTYVYRNAMIGWDNERSFWRDLQDSRSISFQAVDGSVQPPDNTILRYAAIATQYFASAVVVDDHQEQGVDQNFLDWARPTLEQPPSKDQPFLDDISVRLIAKKVDLAPGKPVVHKYLLYNGPVKVAQLASLESGNSVPGDLVEHYANGLHLRTMTDYGRYGWWSDLLVTCTNVMHWLLNGILWVLELVRLPWRHGFAIILLTVVVRGIMFPLSRKQTMAAKRMQDKMQQLKKDLAPELRKIEEKYRDDPMQKRKAEHELYTKNGVNPMAMMNSCWLMFAQMPIFLGLYYALQESIHFRLKTFLWIRNLSAPDMMIPWGEHIPWISDPINLGSFYYLGPFFNLLPIVWVVLMYVQQKVMTPPAADEQQEMQQRMMKFMLFAFFFFFYKVPSGLCIYWIGSMLWTLGERKLLPKTPAATAAPPTTQTTAALRAKRRKGTEAKEKNGDGTLNKVGEWWTEVLKQAKKK